MALLASLVFLAHLAPSAARPACDKATRGAFWPANGASKHAALCVPLEVCTSRFWGHRWETVRVPYWKLAGRPAPQACQSPADTLPEQPDTPAAR